MKYAGSLSIVDDEGKVLHERELDADEIIAYLLSGLANPPIVEPEGAAPAPSPASSSFRDGLKKAATKPSIRREVGMSAPGCDACGSKGWKHKKGCTVSGGAGTVSKSDGEPAPYKGETKGDALTEEQFDMVMDAKENDLHFSSLAFSDEIGVDMREVNRAIITRTWEAYLNSYRLST